MKNCRIEVTLTNENDQIASEIGQIVLTYNAIQVVIFAFFVGFSKMSRKDASKIFYFHKSDRRQRQMTLDLSKSVFENLKKLTLENKEPHWKEKLESMKSSFPKFKTHIRKIVRIALKRNEIVHGALVSDPYGFVAADPFKNNAEKNQHAFQKISEIEKDMENVLAALAEYFNEISVLLQWPETMLV